MTTLKKNLNLLLLATGIVLVWRGVWGLVDTYFFPHSPLLSFVFSIVLGIVVLYIHNPRQKDIRELI